ncbi:hypothetical protein MiSe_32350 [Microseira wollei NIES-4236]|uniref:Transposase n=1 Tax=Microseira wollei NIES-4236 TaxID=2530354 RepID=A0AAV3X6H3_9CYAN|nr:hypothetical protein MiSe_32350 [Microseira wollei NIES-4236]
MINMKAVILAGRARGLIKLNMTLTNLAKKLAALAKKLAGFIRLNCRSLIRKIALEITNAT